jgi:prepilin-type N-terminal cleavage/methylation domain-containing protein
MRDVHRAEDGFTLIELLVAITMSLVLFTALGAVVLSAANQQTMTSNRVTKLLEAQTGIQALGRLIRSATTAAYGGSQKAITLTIPAGNANISGTVTVDCSSGTCQVSTGGTTKLQPLTNVANSDVFTLWCRNSSSVLTTTGCASYTFVDVKVQATISSSHQLNNTSAPGTLELDDGFNLAS